jgi:hypothetical protein
MRFSAVVCAFTFLLNACATTTQIVSEPAGAEVTQDGKKIGVTPMPFETKQWLWETTVLKVEKDGKSKELPIKRSEVDILPMVGGVCGVFLCLPAGVALILAGGMKLPAETKVVLDDKKSAAAPGGPQVAMQY